jgi:hypothetical protein
VIEAEALLAVTGLLLPLPTGDVERRRALRTALIASRIKVTELRTDLLAALERDEPIKLRVNDQKPTYAKRLAAQPDYETTMEDLDDLSTLGLAGAYRLAHENARQILLDRAPKVSIDYVTGPQAQPVDPCAQDQYLHEVDNVENQRIVLDLHSAAILPEAVEVFSACFPEIYDYLVSELRTAYTKKGESGWTPPHWLEYAIRIFLKAPSEGPVDVHSPAAQAPPKPAEEAAPAGSKADLNTKALAVPGTELPK